MTTGPKEQETSTSVTYELAAINLNIGARLQLVTQQTNRPQHYFASLIGYLADVAVLVRTPTENGLSVAFQEGEPLTVRVFSDVHVYSFKTFVDRVLLSPFPCLYLAFPRTVSGTVLRKAMRVKVNIAAQVTRAVPGEPPTTETATVSLTNLSIIGGLVESESKLGEVKEEMEISFAFVAGPGAQEVRITTRAAIRNLVAPKAIGGRQSNLYAHGVEFINLESTDQIMLQNLVYEAFVGSRQSVV
jgi:c-di-GMP-binding flagellar brake protein YcgR